MTHLPRIAALQMTSGPDVSANLATARRLLGAAREAGACVAVLPENFAFMGRSEAERREVVEAPGSGPVQDAIAGTARELGLWIIAGTTPIALPGDPRPANACLVFDDHGRQVARYDKIHLFDVDLPGRDEGYRESANAAPGRVPVVVETPAGRVGLSVCYDLRFPELYRCLVADGAEILSVPAAFTAPTGRAHWEVLLRARAVENLCYVVAAAQSGLHRNGRETFGDTLVADFWGRVLRRRPRGSGVVVAEVDRAAQQRTRRSFPALSHRVLE
jgi:deaminated glutathione amidase